LIENSLLRSGWLSLPALASVFVVANWAKAIASFVSRLIKFGWLIALFKP
jgi:hypothetical protein